MAGAAGTSGAATGTGTSATGTVTLTGATIATPSSASSSASSGGRASGAAADKPAGVTGGVSVTLVSTPNAGASGSVLVVVPANMATQGNGLSVALPGELVAEHTDVKVALADGRPLPGWIRYSATDHTLVLGAVPDRGLPLQVVVESGGKRTYVQVMEDSAR